MPEDFHSREGDRALGDFDSEHPWELCTTLAGGVWGWKPDGAIKSLRDSVQLPRERWWAAMVISSSMSARRPTAGSIRPSRALEGIGDWLRLNGESIYGTRGGPFLPGTYGVSTNRGQKIYVHVLRLERPRTSLLLPAIPAKSCPRCPAGRRGRRRSPRRNRASRLRCRLAVGTIPIPSSCWNSTNRRIESSPWRDWQLMPWRHPHRGERSPAAGRGCFGRRVDALPSEAGQSPERPARGNGGYEGPKEGSGLIASAHRREVSHPLRPGDPHRSAQAFFQD